MTHAAAASHIAPLTGLRAYAALWVMAMHLQFGIGVKPHVQLGTVVAHGYWAVDVFFVLSGLLLSMLYAERFAVRWRLADYVGYLAARFARIYPLHLLALGVLVLAFGLYTGGDPGSYGPGFNLRHLVVNVLLLHAWGFAQRLSWNFPSWSISAEWFAYLTLLPLLARGLRAWTWPLVLAAAGTLWVATWALIHARWGAVGEQAVTLGALLRITAEFALGYALHRVLRQRRPAARLSDLLTVGGLLAIVALCFLPARADLLLAPAVLALLAGLCGDGRLTRTLFAHPWAVFWGERSYSIYMLHGVVQLLCTLLLTTLGATVLDAPAAVALYATQVALVLLLSHLAYGWFEVPMRERVREAIVTRVRRPLAATEPA